MFYRLHRHILQNTILLFCLFPLIGISQDQATFQLLDPKESGFDLFNFLDEDHLKNPFNYVYAYNGGGVSIGDINNDGLQDIYVTANMSSSKLFLNKGNMKFEDISTKAGVTTDGWSTATAMADVNDDGWTDIYVCRSYHDAPEDRENLLFINNKDNTFTESAKSYGLNDANFSIGCTFFDHDLDGDLDLFVANHPRYRLVSMKIHMNYAKDPVEKYSNKLFRNDGNGKFTNVTESLGLKDYSFSLGISAINLDQDNYPDLFITVDFDEPDVLMQNIGGEFQEITESAFNSISRFSMGVDAGDINGDGHLDFVVSEMLNSTHFREKAEMAMINTDVYNFFVDSLGYINYQMRNFLHLNNGDLSFSDMARIANIHKTDWSWSPLLFDADNDGDLDLHITNGYYRDIINRDRKRTLDSTLVSYGKDMRRVNAAASHYARNCPQTKLPNFLFQNNGDLTFDNITEGSGTGQKTISNGSAYADLDNDGDLDLVVNNLGEPSMIYENVSAKSNFFRVAFEHSKGHPFWNSKVELIVAGKSQVTEVLNARGYQSNSEPIAHFGLGKNDKIDMLKVTWPDGKMQEVRNPKINNTLVVKYENAKSGEVENKALTLMKKTDPKKLGLEIGHVENFFNDYSVQVLLPHKMSEQGPFITVDDSNGDGLEDIFIGGSLGQPGKLMIQNDQGFSEKENVFITMDKMHEDAESIFFDADGDGDKDLLVCSGGYEFSDARAYEQRLYINNGKGNYMRKIGAFPDWYSSTSCARVSDFDNDGDLDVLFGGRLAPSQYPLPGMSALFVNDGQGAFSNATGELIPELERIGMVTDVMWHDFNADGRKDLLIVGEWMAPRIFIQENGIFKEKSDDLINENITGWWNTIHKADLDGDGRQDFVLGNLGLNYKYKASKEEPFIVFANDFDKSGSCDIALAEYEGETLYPVRGRACSAEQIPAIKQKFRKFDAFAGASMEDIYGAGLETAVKYEATEFASVVLYGKGTGFDIVRLPNESQLSPINGIVSLDLNGDGMLDLVHAGNLYQSEIETGRADAGIGMVLINQGNRQWNALRPHESGFVIRGDTKSLKMIKVGKDERPYILAGNNKGPLDIHTLNTSHEEPDH